MVALLFACRASGARPRHRRLRAWIMVSSIGWLVAPSVHAQSLTGAWLVVAEELSNTCGDPLAPADANTVAIIQAGSLLAVDLTPVEPNQRPIEGDRSGSSIRIGYETFEGGGATIVDPAATSLSLNASATRFSGLLPWEFFGPQTCTGTQTWSASRTGSPTPGNLSHASWNVTVTEQSDSCGPVDPTPVGLPVSIVQSGSLVEILASDFGQTRFRGRVTGQTLNLGLAIREAGGDFTIYDAADDPLTISAGFDSFSGTMHWTAYQELVCTGVDRVTAYLPEPEGATAIALGCIALALASRRRGAVDRPGVTPPAAAAASRARPS